MRFVAIFLLVFHVRASLADVIAVLNPEIDDSYFTFNKYVGYYNSCAELPSEITSLDSDVVNLGGEGIYVMPPQESSTISVDYSSFSNVKTAEMYLKYYINNGVYFDIKFLADGSYCKVWAVETIDRWFQLSEAVDTESVKISFGWNTNTFVLFDIIQVILYDTEVSSASAAASLSTCTGTLFPTSVAAETSEKPITTAKQVTVTSNAPTTVGDTETTITTTSPEATTTTTVPTTTSTTTNPTTTSEATTTEQMTGNSQAAITSDSQTTATTTTIVTNPTTTTDEATSSKEEVTGQVLSTSESPTPESRSADTTSNSETTVVDVGTTTTTTAPAAGGCVADTTTTTTTAATPGGCVADTTTTTTTATPSGCVVDSTTTTTTTASPVVCANEKSRRSDLADVLSKLWPGIRSDESSSDELSLDEYAMYLKLRRIVKKMRI